MKIRLTALVVALSTALACNSSSTVGSVVGSINGRSFQAADAIAANVQVTTTSTQGLVTIASASGLCADVTANKEPKNTQYLLLVLSDVDPTTLETRAPTAPGVYVVSPGTCTLPAKWGTAFYTQTDATCQNVPQSFEAAFDGTITLSSVNNGSYSGSFDFRIRGIGVAPTDHITGVFNAPNCPGRLVIFTSQNRTTTCF